MPQLWQIIGITLAMVGARSAAMTFNRIADREIDAENPRTAGVSCQPENFRSNSPWAFFFASVALFVIAAYSLNWLTLALSPVALASIIGYSYAKRFTSMSHLFLGWALAISPTAAWIAVRGTIDSEIPLAFVSISADVDRRI